MTATLELACGGDLGYLPHTAAMVSSVLEHSGSLRVRVHYLHDPALAARDARSFAQFVAARGGELRLIPVAADRLEGLPSRKHLPPAVWHRCFLPELAPDVPRALYFDGDAIAVDSLEPLWSVDMGGCVAGAVSNVPDPWNIPYQESLGLPTPYFNSGVLLLDLDRMRAEGLQEQIVATARANVDRLPWGDQDPLNLVLSGTRVELDPRWNVMNSFYVYADHAAELFGRERYEEALRRPAIRHFEGPEVNKPWHLLCDRPGAEEYFRHRRMTPWPRVRRDGVTPANLARLAKRRLVRA